MFLNINPQREPTAAPAILSMNIRQSNGFDTPSLWLKSLLVKNACSKKCDSNGANEHLCDSSTYGSRSIAWWNLLILSGPKLLLARIKRIYCFWA
jgi:hypothetical protein